MKSIFLYFSVMTDILLDAIKPSDFFFFSYSHVQLYATKIYKSVQGSNHGLIWIANIFGRVQMELYEKKLTKAIKTR